MAIQKTTLRTTASGFSVAACVLMAFTIIGLAWMIPMTIAIRKRIKNNQVIGLGLPICYIIFGGLFAMVAGILLIIDYSKQQ